jgi:hypothetical protein
MISERAISVGAREIGIAVFSVEADLRRRVRDRAGVVAADEVNPAARLVDVSAQVDT